MSDLFSLPICSTFPLLCNIRLFGVHVPQTEFHRPITQRAAGQEGGKKREGGRVGGEVRSFLFQLLLPKIELRTHQKNERAQKSRVYVPHVVVF